MSFLLGDLNDNESPKSIWLGAREKEEGGGEGRRGGHCRLTPRKRWENAVLTEREGERKRNEKRDFDFSSGEKLSNHGEFVFEASPSSHDRGRGCESKLRNSET